jgi:hypothetical protein
VDPRKNEATFVVRDCNSAEGGTRVLKVYRGSLFSWCCQRGKRNAYPRPPVQGEEWWNSVFRLQLDGRWLRDRRVKYRFYSLQEVFDLLAELGGISPQQQKEYAQCREI